MKLIDFKKAVCDCLKGAPGLEGGVNAVNTLLESQGLAKIIYFRDTDEAEVSTENGMPCGVLAAVEALREKYKRPISAYAT
jgi:hypothetical protein